jgi:hypothetical protein
MMRVLGLHTSSYHSVGRPLLSMRRTDRAVPNRAASDQIGPAKAALARVRDTRD